jgi:hypothetical protein
MNFMWDASPMCRPRLSSGVARSQARLAPNIFRWSRDFSKVNPALETFGNTLHKTMI